MTMRRRPSAASTPTFWSPRKAKPRSGSAGCRRHARRSSLAGVILNKYRGGLISEGYGVEEYYGGYGGKGYGAES